MIKAQELRIGNRVKCNGIFCRIIQIGTTENNKFKGVVVTVDDEYRYPSPDYGTIEPIPLTPAILERLEFRKLTSIGTWAAPTNAFLLNLDFMPLSRDNWQIIGIKQESLHQLQNLYFALTGTELPVKNLMPEDYNSVNVSL